MNYWKLRIKFEWILLILSATKLQAKNRWVRMHSGLTKHNADPIKSGNINASKLLNKTVSKRFIRSRFKVDENVMKKGTIEDLLRKTNHVHDKRKYESFPDHSPSVRNHFEFPEDDPMLMGEDDLSTREHHLNHFIEDDRTVLGRCDINRQCKDDQYCDNIYCYKCRSHGEHCTANGECCKGIGCQFGYCSRGSVTGSPGTFCDKSKDCKGPDMCCILEISVDSHNPVCKSMLDVHETCGPINLFHQLTKQRAHNEPICGPCKPGLACKSVGINGHHSICLPDTDHD